MLMILCFSTYLISLLFFSSSTSLLVLFLFLEILSWVFVVILPKASTMKYLLIQSYFMVLALGSIFWVPLLLNFSLMLKLGLPPFHFWFISFSIMLSNMVFLFMTTMHKLLPYFILGKSLLFLSGISINMLILISMSIMLFQSSSFFLMLAFSSLIHSIWMTVSLLVSKAFSIAYWGLYSIVMVTLLQPFSMSSLLNLFLSQASLMKLSWMVLSGMPPLSLFWLKTNLVVFFIYSLSECYGYLLIFSSVLSLFIYFLSFHLSMLQYPLAFFYFLSPGISLVFVSALF